jgi:hypothetical protein
MPSAKLKDCITLKEASKLSGYAPDYLGQLIRKGKLPGKQVYCNVAWVTTETAVREYIEKEKNRKPGEASTGKVHDEWQRLLNRVLSETRLEGLMKGALIATFAIACAVLVTLFYVFAVNVDKEWQRRLIQNSGQSGLQAHIQQP